VKCVWAAGSDLLVLSDSGEVQAFAYLHELTPFLVPEMRRAHWNTTHTFLATESVYLAPNWPFGVHLLVQQAGKMPIEAHHRWRGPVREAHVLGGDVIGIPKGALHRGLALASMRYLMSKPIQQPLVAALGWSSFRSDASRRFSPGRSPSS
jgi:trehalose transport system substrate-binding protein